MADNTAGTTQSLDMLAQGESASILSVGGEGALRQHFLDMGVIPGTEVSVIKLALWATPWSCRSTDMS